MEFFLKGHQTGWVHNDLGTSNMNLDIDNSSINNKLRFVPDDSEDNGISWLPNDKPKTIAKYKKIEPFPGICVKTWSKSGDKIFINLCHSREMIPPENITDEQYYDMMNNGGPSFVIPMAIGTEKMSKDKGDIERSTFDILINTSYYVKCKQKEHFLYFTITATLQSINDKYKKCINASKFVILKNRKVLGYLDTFTIEDRAPKSPSLMTGLIQEIDIPEDISEPEENTDSIYKYNPKVNNFVIIKSNSEDHLIGLYYLPSSNLKDIIVDVGENRIIIENQKAEIMIDTLLPYNIDNSHVFANFDSKLHILRLTLPLKI